MICELHLNKADIDKETSLRKMLTEKQSKWYTNTKKFRTDTRMTGVEETKFTL